MDTKTSHKRPIKILLSCTGICLLLYFFVCAYFINYAFVKKEEPVSDFTRDAITWLESMPQETWQQTSSDDAHIDLKAIYLPAQNKTNKTILVAHGWHGNAKHMAPYIKMFHELGYNVLAPDDRGCGQSSGRYTTFGWTDRKDYLGWINQIIEKQGQDSQIALFGVSMGGATVMNVSGETLPPQVTCIVEDCGFSSIAEEFSHVLEDDYGLPSQVILSGCIPLAQPRIGFNIYEADTKQQLAKNKLPIFFIHGDSDTFVPTSMVYRNYSADTSEKQLWITQNTEHAKSLENHPEEYKSKVAQFLSRYLK